MLTIITVQKTAADPSFRDNTVDPAEGIASDAQADESKITVGNPETGIEASPAEMCEPVPKTAGEPENALALAQEHNKALQNRIKMLQEAAITDVTAQKREQEVLQESALTSQENFERTLREKQHSLDEHHEKIQRLTRQVEIRNRKLETLKADYETIKRSLHAQIQRNVVQGKELRELRDQVSKDDKKLEHLASQIESEISSADKNFETWSTQAGRAFMSVDKALKDSQENLDKATVVNTALKLSLESANADKQSMIWQLTQSANDSVTYESKIASLEMKCKTLEAKDSKQAARLTEALEKNKKMKEAIAAAQAEVNKAKKAHAKERHDLETRLAEAGSANGYTDLQHDLTIARNDIRALKEKAKAAETEADLAKQKAAAAAKDASAAVKKEVATAKKMAAEAAKKEVAAAKKTAAEAAKEVTERDNKLEAAEREVIAAVKRITVADKEVTAAKKETVEAMKKVATRDGRITTMERELATAKAQLEAAVKKATGAEREVATANKKAARAMNECVAERNKAANFEKEAAAAKEQKVSAIKEATAAKMEATKAQQETAAFRERAVNAEWEAAAAEKRADDATTDVSTLKVKEAIMRNRAEAAEREVAKDINRDEVEAAANETIKHLQEQLADGLNLGHFHRFPAQTVDSVERPSEGVSTSPARQHLLQARHTGRLRSASDSLHGDNDPRKNNRIAELEAKNTELMAQAAEGGAHSPQIYPSELHQIQLLKTRLSEAVEEGWELKAQNHGLWKMVREQEQAAAEAVAPAPAPDAAEVKALKRQVDILGSRVGDAADYVAGLAREVEGARAKLAAFGDK